VQGNCRGEIDEGTIVVTTRASVLLFEEDELSAKTMTAVLEAEGYDVIWTVKAGQASTLIGSKYFDVIIITADPHGKNLTLLEQPPEGTLATIKIVVTSYPSSVSIDNVFALGVHAYFVKPIEPQEFLETIKSKLFRRLEPPNRSEGKRFSFSARGGASKDFQEYLENMAQDLSAFGLTTNQGKVYVTMLAGNLATALDVATHSGIRREEVYRIIPELEELGIITKKMGPPLKFTAVSPEIAVDNLMKTKFSKAAQELNKLIEKRTDFTVKVKKAELQKDAEPNSVTKIPNTEQLFVRFHTAYANAHSCIDQAMPNEFLKFAHVNFAHLFNAIGARGVTTRIITEEKVLDAENGWLGRMANDVQFKTLNESGVLKLRFLSSLPFNAIIVDQKTAIWGEFQTKNDQLDSYWSNQSAQVEILKTAFDSLWKNAAPLGEKLMREEKTE
jgi:CheY-like chemotaxis protein